MSALNKDALSKNACSEIPIADDLADDPDMEEIVSQWYVMGPDHTNKPPAQEKIVSQWYTMGPDHTSAPSAQDIEDWKTFIWGGLPKKHQTVEVESSCCPECKGTGILDFEFYTRKCKCQLDG